MSSGEPGLAFFPLRWKGKIQALVGERLSQGCIELHFEQEVRNNEIYINAD